MAIDIKNYTTEVTAAKSIGLIEQLLVDFGAYNIMKEYETGKVQSISFIIDVDGMRMPFKLPANVQQVAAWLKKKKPAMKDKTRLDQAERIAWKQQYEILHLQLGQIEMQQLDRLEVFLPFLWDAQKRETFYQKLKTNGFKQLTYSE